MSFLSSIVGVVKNAVVGDEVRQKVLEATGDEKWGPTGTQMQELAQMSFAYDNFSVLLDAVFERLTDDGTKGWRNIYKALLVLEYLLRSGSQDVVIETRAKVFELQGLRDYQKEEEGKDVGISVRQKAKYIIELLHDDARLEGEREKVTSLSIFFLNFL